MRINEPAERDRQRLTDKFTGRLKRTYKWIDRNCKDDLFKSCYYNIFISSVLCNVSKF